MTAAPARQVDPLLQAVTAAGFLRLDGPELIERLWPGVTPAALAAFAASWERLEVDRFMADGGRYRRRRIANFATRSGVPGHVRGEHRPHFQAVVHNALNGGVDRWFAPVEPEVAEGPVTLALLGLGRAVADAVHGAQDWFVEMHQFRIEAAAGAPGYPTPEGVHQDGVDLVLIVLIARTNLSGGATIVTDLDGTERARFTLGEPMAAVLVDDRRLMHGVTPVEPGDPALPSRRDVLVLTWRRQGTTG